MHDAVLDVVVFTLLAGLVLAPLERVLHERDGVRRSFATDLAFATFGQLLVRCVLFVVLGVVLAWLVALAPESSPGSRIASLHPSVAGVVDVVVGLVVFELMGYAYHRLAHVVPALSRLHDVHHSSESLDWLASFRQHPLEIALVTLAQNAPLVLLGIPLGSHALVVILLRLHTVFVHSNVRVPNGPWTRWIATPRFHHRHHDRDRPAANFATLSPLLDRLFGTYDGARAGALGSPTTLPTSFLGLLLHPFRAPPTAVDTSLVASASRREAGLGLDGSEAFTEERAA